MKRSTPLRRRTRVKRANRARKASEFARTYHSKERVAFVKSLPCVMHTYRCEGRAENAHLGNGGMGRKSDHTNIVPLCRYHHRELHRLGVERFEDFYDGVSLPLFADNTEALWQEHVAAWQRHSREGGE